MGLETLQRLQILHLPVPHSVSSCRKPLYARSYSVSSFLSLNNQSFTHSFGRSSNALFGSAANLKTSGLKRSCSADSHQFFDDEFAKHIADLARKFDVIEDDEKDNNNNDTASAVSEISISHNDDKNSEKSDSSMSFLPSKIEFLEPNLLGITPEPPEWPERDEIEKITIQFKVKSVDIPLSLRMIGRKHKWQEGFVDGAGDFAYCSVKKAFSSMVFMVRELQNHALSIRGRLYSEDLEAIVNKVQKEMNASFVWLFQQVFSRTPTLMVYVMLLLANFTVHSMADDMEATASHSMKGNLLTTEEKMSEEQICNGGRSPIRYPDMGLNEIIEFSGNQEMTEEEEMELWNLVLEEASMLREESTYPVLEQEKMKNLVSSMSVEIEPDDYMEFHKTDLVYQMGVAKDPNNPLLLSNYAQFLYVVRHDYDRAEECFKRAIMSGPPDAETFSRYADFLWVARKDLWNAEEVYQQAVEAAPDSHHYASKYANFLWSTGGEDTCFPLTASQ